MKQLGREADHFGCLVCVCVYSVFVLSSVYVEALRQADHSSKESYRLKNDHETEKQMSWPKGAVKPVKKVIYLISLQNTG
jgi:hypothetical protein